MPVVWLGDRGPGDEPPNYTGLDVVIVRDGKIAALYVFLDPVQS
jgi:ketosteroid isomerase-like protein